MSAEDTVKVCTDVEAWLIEKGRVVALLRTAETDLVVAAVRCLESHLKAGLFLISPSAQLSGRIPLEIARTPEGKQEVLDLIGRLEHSVY